MNTSKTAVTSSKAVKLDTLDSINKEITLVCQQAGKLQNRIQTLAVSIVVFANGKGSGNVTPAKALVDGLGKGGLRRDSLVEWFSKVGIMFSEEGEVSLDRTRMTAENLDAGKKLPWYMAKPEKNPFKPFDFKAQLARDIKAAWKAQIALADPDVPAEVKASMQVTASECEALEKFAIQMLGADMPKKPDLLKLKLGESTATGTQTKGKKVA